jgi:hypothetical protein
VKQSNDQALTLELRHTGERLTLRRIKTDNGVEELRLTARCLPIGEDRRFIFTLKRMSVGKWFQAPCPLWSTVTLL